MRFDPIKFDHSLHQLTLYGFNLFTQINFHTDAYVTL